MKTLSILGAVLATFLPAFQGSAGDSPPPFPEASKPGLYVNSKIGFALPYPEDFTPVQPQGSEIFRAEPQNRYPSLRVWFIPNLKMPLKNLSRMWKTNLKDYSKDAIKVVFDQDAEAASGVLAREIELEWVTNEKTPRPGMKVNSYYYAVKRSNGWIVAGVTSTSGAVKKEIKEKIYMMQLKPEAQAKAS